MTTVERLKLCSGCGRDLPLTQFYEATAASDGRQSRCKECAAASSRERSRRRREEARAEPEPEPMTEWQCDNCGERWFRPTGQDGGQCPRCREVFTFRTGRYTQPDIADNGPTFDAPAQLSVSVFEVPHRVHLPAIGAGV